jgi:hypothetical protein
MPKQVTNVRRTRGAVAPLALLGLMITAGCAGQSEVTDLWKDPSYTSGPMHNVLIVAAGYLRVCDGDVRTRNQDHPAPEDPASVHDQASSG